METVSATDPDEGGNGQFRYSIESGDPDDQFAIDGTNTFHLINITVAKKGLLFKMAFRIPLGTEGLGGDIVVHTPYGYVALDGILVEFCQFVMGFHL